MYDYIVQRAPFAHKFTGKERDSESGLDNFGARYNASTMGRFMTPDPLGGHQEDPQTLNKYAYVRNNPLNRTDPTGLDLYLQGCGDASTTCKDNFVGTTDDKGHFTRTTIQSDASGNFDGHDVSFDSSGIHIDDKYQGVYAPGTDATRVNGDEDSGFAGTHFVVNSNCLGTCLAGGGLYSDNGGTSVFKGVIATLEGPNKGLDKYGDHPGDQYRGGNKNGPDAHLSYVTDQNGNPTNGMPFHIDTRNPFHSTGGFLGHTGDLIGYKFKAGILREQGPPMPADIRPKDNQ
jgi:RHS repeat-associated protein